MPSTRFVFVISQIHLHVTISYILLYRGLLLSNAHWSGLNEWSKGWTNESSQIAKHREQGEQISDRLQAVSRWWRAAGSGTVRRDHRAALWWNVDVERCPSNVTASLRRRRTTAEDIRSISRLRCPNATCTAWWQSAYISVSFVVNFFIAWVLVTVIRTSVQLITVSISLLIYV